MRAANDTYLQAPVVHYVGYLSTRPRVYTHILTPCINAAKVRNTACLRRYFKIGCTQPGIGERRNAIKLDFPAFN